MPFVKRSGKHTGTPIASGAPRVFVGRESEIQFFRRHILEPEIPEHNLVSFYGQGGVGKSTLLTHLEGEIRASPDYSDSCVIARVDERQLTPSDVMETFAKRLHLKGDFEKAIETHKEALRQLHGEREHAEEEFGRKAVGKLANLAASSVPAVGPLISQGAEKLSEFLWDEMAFWQRKKNAKRLDNPLESLTRTFVAELNKLAERDDGGSRGHSRSRHVILFFDTFEYLAPVIAPWLLNVLLEQEINENVVLVVAGREPLSSSTPEDPKRWLQYGESEQLREIEVTSFSREETQLYLAQQKISDAARIEQIWKLSHGLPLYLSMLTVNLAGELDPTASVVQNFLRWIPQEDGKKRRLVLEVAFLSYPFNSDDLRAFPYVGEEERAGLYLWLIAQPFVRDGFRGGRRRYHDAAQEMFRRYLYSNSPDDCRKIRLSLVDYYQKALQAVELVEGQHAHKGEEWFELNSALAQQLLVLPDITMHARATALVVQAIGTESEGGRSEKIAKILHHLLDAEGPEVSATARALIGQLLVYLDGEADPGAWHEAVQSLMQKIQANAAIATESLVLLHLNRARKYREANDAENALLDCGRVLALQPDHVEAFNHKGFLLNGLGRYAEAEKTYEEALRINPRHTGAWLNKGIASFRLNFYERALSSFEEVIKLDPKYIAAYYNKGTALYALGRKAQADEVFDAGLKLASLDPTSANGWFKRGFILARDRQEEALAAFSEATRLDPQLAEAWHGRGDVLHRLGRNQDALLSLESAISANPRYTEAWCYKGYVLVELGRYEEALADYRQALSLDPQVAYAWNDVGFVLIKLQRHEEALRSLDRSLKIDPKCANPWRWKGEAWRELNQLEKAIECFDEALSLRLPYAGASYSRAAALEQLGRRSEALAAYGDVIELESNDSDHYHGALAAFTRAIEANPLDADSWFKKGKALDKLQRKDEASAAYAKAMEIDPQYHYQSKWSSNFGRNLSPEMIKDKYLDVEIVMLLNGQNQAGESIYTYLEVSGRNLKRMFTAMKNNEEFKPKDFGNVLAAGKGEPTKEVRAEMCREYNMIEVPVPGEVLPIMQSRSPDGDGIVQ